MARDTPAFDAALAFGRFFSAGPELLCVAEIGGCMRVANEAWREALGWSPEDLTARPYLDFVHPDDAAATRDSLRAWGAAGGSVRFVNRFRHRDGGYRLLEWRAVAPPAEGLIYATARDVTVDRRRAVLGEQIEKITGVGGWEIDVDTKSIFWSPMTYAIHEVDPLRFTPGLDDAMRFYPPEAQPVLQACVSRLMTLGQPYDVELPFVTGAGRKLWVRATAAAEMKSGSVARAYGTFQDVTAQRAERLRRQRIGAVAQKTDRVAIVCDSERRIEWVNPAFERMTGYRADEVMGRSPGALPQAEGASRATVAAIRKALNAARGIACEILNRGKNGRESWLDLKIQPLRDEGGALTGFMAVEHDITRRKSDEARLAEAERAARAAQAQLASAVAALPDGFVLFDADQRIVLCNDRLRELYPLLADAIRPGARFEDLLRLGVERGQYAEAVGCEEEWLARQLAGYASPGASFERQLADGRWIRAVDRATPDGGRVGLRIDITELKRARQRLEDVIEGAQTGTWEWNVATGETTYNARWAEMLGYTLGELGARNHSVFESMAHPDDLRVGYERLAQHFRGETPFFENEIRVRHRDGHWVWIHDRGRVAQRAADGTPILMSGTHHDITVRKLAEEALETALRRAEQATAAKSMFLANMSHEIRTPMNGVLGMAEALSRATTDPAQKRMVAVIRESGEVLMSIINDILDFSKIEAGRLDLEAIPFLPADLARRVESLHALKAAEKGLSLEVLTSNGADVARRGDPHRLQQVLHNLVSNAIKFTETGEVVVTFSCAPSKPLVIEVRDTGVGMSPEQVDTVFDEFTQADSSTTRRFGGTGLGMAIVRRIVEAMDGEITVESRLGEGTRVRVALPLEALGRDESAPRAPETDRRGLWPGLRVLAADDNEINRIVLQAMLDELGVSATMVEGGREAVAACDAQSFDLLLLDISMPVMDGLQALAAIRARETTRGAAPVPAIAVTANALKHQVDAYLAAGFDGHVAKPIHPVALRDCIGAVARVSQR